MNLKPELEKSLSTDRLHLLHLVADVAGSLGFPVYMVGGSVRDLLLGRAIHDFDLTVEGDAGKLAETILLRLGGKILIHSQFGTARWTLNEASLNRLGVPHYQAGDLPPFLDFVSARSETYPSPGVLPVVKRSTIDDDLHRRDFTINAMAIRLDGINFGVLLDPLKGLDDLEKKTIRVIHPKSFLDDPTRMVRAVRYAMRYDFEIQPDTLTLINDESRVVLAQLSGERLRHEFDLIFEEEQPLLALDELADETGLAKAVHPALENAQPLAVSAMSNRPEQLAEFEFPEMLSFRQTLGWTLYLKQLPEMDINSIATRLAFPAVLTKTVLAASVLVRRMNSSENWKPSQWTFYLDDLPTLALYAEYLTGNEQMLRDYLTLWRGVQPYTSGNDLIALGLEPGPKFKDILTQLRAAWIDGEVNTLEEEKQLLGKLIQ
jgi:tRNA nucleotidyltransferase (CCA-adding enzyme)